MDFDKYYTTLSWPTLSDGLDKDELKRKREEYNKDVRKLEDKFVVDTIDWYRLPDNAITRKMYALAWEYGHSSGYNEVFNIFADFADLYEYVVKHKDDLK